MIAPRWLTWLTCTHDQWGTLARLVAIHYTIGVPQ